MAKADTCACEDFEYRRQEDKGWRWNVILAGPRRAMVVQVMREPTPPPRIERLTPRVREVVKFLHRVTDLPCQAPITTDVSKITPGFWNTRFTMRTRRHGPVEAAPPYKPLK